MQFLIRDDDASAMTRPEEIEQCYASVWNEIPIGLSVTPFRIPGDYVQGVPDHLLGSQEPLPLAENREMVAFLREHIAAGRVFVAMHGYHHTRPSGQAEYVSGEDLFHKTSEGRRYLEETLNCRISTFVPPNNGVSEVGFQAVVGAGLNLVANQTLHLSFLRALGGSAQLNQLIDLQYRLRIRLGIKSAFSKRRYIGFQQAPYQTLGPSQSLPDLEAALDRCQKQEGLFILATHYHAFGRRMASGETIADGFSRLIDRARSGSRTKFIGYDQLW